jgi:hypothetical protein
MVFPLILLFYFLLFQERERTERKGENKEPEVSLTLIAFPTVCTDLLPIT